jgi:hypothetical protein
MPSPTTRTFFAYILSLILCCSSFTPGRLNPAFKPLGCLNTGFAALLPAVVDGVVTGFVKFGFLLLIVASALLVILIYYYKFKNLIFD